jgi:translation initiation factor 2 subunit 2
MALHMVP